MLSQLFVLQLFCTDVDMPDAKQLSITTYALIPGGS